MSDPDPTCGLNFYPPRELCINDLATCEEIELSQHGTIYESAVVEIAPEGFEAPYRVAYVDLPEGVRVFAPVRWTGPTAPRPGDQVKLTVDVVRREPEVIGPVFVGPV